MQVSILGPLEVRAGDRAVALGGVKQRALLAVLALHANEPVSAERLALALWGQDAPPGAVKTVQVHVSRLRKALRDPDVLTTTPAGYRLGVRPGELDLERFDRLVAAGREALTAGRPEQAAAVLREALELWRGPPLAEVASLPFAPPEIARLDEQRLAALELRVEADLAAGRDAELIPELQQLTSEHPWRERLHAQHMLALYRAGRQADALEAYRAARQVLVDGLGIEPGEELAGLHHAILAQDPGLHPPPWQAAEFRDPDRGLPVPPNRTIGRGRELAAVAERLRASSVRLLTLTGPGGVGKTRLAIEAARAAEPDFADRAHFVSLAALQRPEDVPAAIVRALGVVVLSGESAEQAVERFLAGKHLLLVVDNCEHVLGVAPFLGGLLRSCPSVTMLATSREPLALQAEERHPVPPLALPERGSSEYPPTLAGADAVMLFAERARAHDPQFDLGDGNAAPVAEICRRVDGLPLAIELAAARCGLLSPTEIAERLDAALAALGAGARDAPARQQTLRATIDWSHDLLSDNEKACFARFAVFAGGATVEAAETITDAGLDTLDGLVTKSLLARRQHALAPTRLEMLETIRAYATERLAAAEGDAVRERHYGFFLALAQRHGTDRALMGTDRQGHLSRLDADFDNVHAALAWALGRPDAEPALSMCAALGQYWRMRGRYADAVQWADQVLRMPAAGDHAQLRIGVLCTKAAALWGLGRAREQSAVLAEAEVGARALADPLILSQTLQMRASFEGMASRDVAEALADEALDLATAAQSDWAIAMAHREKVMAAATVGELRERVERATAFLDGVGNVFHLAGLLASAAYGAVCLGSDPYAKELVDRAVPLVRALDDRHSWMLFCGNVGLATLLTGDTDAAQNAFREELELCRDRVVPALAYEALRGLAAVAAVHDDSDRAARLAGAASAHRYGHPQDPVDARLDADFFEPARTRYGTDAWNAAARDGATLSFEDAIVYALEEQRA
jgi:predicted ATPase/DNA-binding SARP family transcriptional activator